MQPPHPVALTNLTLHALFARIFGAAALLRRTPDRTSQPESTRCTATAAIPAPNCGNPTSAPTVRLSGWVHRVRDHGGLLFIDLRDHYGITQIVADPDSPAFKTAETVRGEWVIRVDGEVKARAAETVNANLPTGEIEVFAREIEVLSAAKELPLPVFGEPDYPEDIRLKYRFLDLRRDTLHKNIMARTKIIAEMRRRMGEAGFTEYSTPILTASSPEGARDFLVPSPHPSGQVLRAAAGAAAVQAADHGVGLRPLFPDRAMLPRRGPARRPPAGRVLPARPRDELRRAGGRVRGRGAGACAACSRRLPTASR